MRALARIPMSTSRRLTTAVAATTVVFVGLSAAALPVSAATSTTTPKSSTPTTLSPAQRQKDEKAFQQCLASKGVKLPSFNRGAGAGGGPPFGGAHGSFQPGQEGGFRPPSGSGSGSFGGGFAGGSNSKFAKAFQACRSKLPRGAFGFGFGGGGGGFQFHPTAAQAAALKTYEQCMTSHGVQIASNTSFQTIQSLIRSDPTAASANKACQSDLQGVFGPPPGSHPGAPTSA